jgi:isopentenyl-diphosphate delta-isomerase
MTGGTARADKLNAALVEVACQHQIAVGLGSQRASLEGGQSQKNLRKNNPKACLIGNLGAVQIIGDDGFALAQRAVADIEADALAIHLNPLQEAIQPEGDYAWQGVEAAITRLVDKLGCPILVKEVGAGLSASVVRRLYAAGVRHVDVAARGGTNWALIEWLRQNPDKQALYDPFLSMGIDLPDAVRGGRHAAPDITIIASGGVQNGLDIAKTLYLGADMGGMAGVMLQALEDEARGLHPSRLSEKIEQVQTQLRLACFLTGSKSARDLQKLPIL